MSAWNPYGACRMCLVEVEGARGPVAGMYRRGHRRHGGPDGHRRTWRGSARRWWSCSSPTTRWPAPDASNRVIASCRRWPSDTGWRSPSYQGEEHDYPLHCENSFITRDYNKCVMCGRCIRICREVQGVGVYDFVNRGFAAVPGTPYDKPMQETPCEFCGQCISTCPTGAIKGPALRG